MDNILRNPCAMQTIFYRSKKETVRVKMTVWHIYSSWKHIIKGRGGPTMTFTVNTKIPMPKHFGNIFMGSFQKKKKETDLSLCGVPCCQMVLEATRHLNGPLSPTLHPNHGANECRTMRSIQPRLAVLLNRLLSRILSLFDFKKPSDCPISGSIFFFLRVVLFWSLQET